MCIEWLRERERQTDRQTDRDTDRDTERERIELYEQRNYEETEKKKERKKIQYAFTAGNMLLVTFSC